MTRKDYQRIARAMFIGKPDLQALSRGQRLQTWSLCVTALIIELREDNPNFNKDLFKYACKTGDVRARKPKAA